jgi:twitching motility protein PilT
MPKVGGGRIAAIEILVSNSRTREYIEKGEREGRSITDAMNDGALDGMQTFDKVLERYIREGVITREICLAYASNPSNLTLAISDLDRDAAAAAEAAAEADRQNSLEEVSIPGFERMPA